MELVKKFKELYHEMKESRDVANMRTFGKASNVMFSKLAEVHPEMAEEWLAMLAPIKCHNYLTDEEAGEIAVKFVSQDGSEGAYWDKTTLEQAIMRFGGLSSNPPHYNFNALWVTTNMIYSDHAKSIAEDMGYHDVSSVPAERLAKSCYRKAVEKLTDVDRPRFVREYFHIE